ncbi:HAMP domain-containing histidine kinase [bacterium]|nr:HAMP domain-containing histidine kinase [bacterium]
MDKGISKLIRPLTCLKKRLAFKVILWIGLILVVFLELVCYLDLRSHKNLLFKQMKEEAYRLSDIIKRSTHHDMMRARSNELQEVLETIGSQEDVRKARIIERGRVKMASQKEEVGREVDKKAEACYDCHEEEGKKPLTVTRYRFFKTEDGERVLGFVNPLYNDEECHSCHGSDTEVLGVLDIILSMEKVYKNINIHQNRSFIFILAGFVLIAISIGILILRFVNRPIKQLSDGTKRITNGDLKYHIPINTEDEIGELAASFNNMTDNLRASRKEIEAWNEELSDRVKVATTQLEKTNNDLEIANKKLSESDKKKSEVVMLVAHDIRAPLASIKSCLKVVLDGYLKNDRPKEMEMIRRAEERVESQLDFVKNLLDFTRMEEEHREMRPIEIKPIVKNVADMMQAWANDKHIKVEIRNLPDVSIMGDEDLIERSLANLISNAIKYNPPDTLIWVDCLLKGELLEIEVGDNGVGIPDDEIPELFEILFRGVNARRQQEHGSGLGLSIVKRAVNIHGGHIRVESKLGAGTSFFITLPVLKSEKKEELASAHAISKEN